MNNNPSAVQANARNLGMSDIVDVSFDNEYQTITLTPRGGNDPGNYGSIVYDITKEGMRSFVKAAEHIKHYLRIIERPIEGGKRTHKTRKSRKLRR